MSFITNLYKRINHRVTKYRTSTFVSFTKPLSQLASFIQPQTVIEFGPGHSTKLFLKHTNAEIWSFETNIEWFTAYQDKFDSNRVHVIHKQPGWPIRDIRDYIDDVAPIVFIDGGDRPLALKEAYSLIGTNGVVFLHDAHREDYEEGIRLYPFIFFPERHSCILTNDEKLHQKIKEVVTIDYSCKCQYCSSDSRRAYFERMSQLD